MLTVKQAADHAGVSVKTIFRLVASGRLRFTDYGTKKQHAYRFLPEWLAAVSPLPEVEEAPPGAIRRRRHRQSASSVRASIHPPA